MRPPADDTMGNAGIDVPLHTTAEVADMRGVSERTVRRWCESGEVWAMKVGATWRIRLDPEPIEVRPLPET